jgi:ribosomal protein S18 acetylase RimI-like enzyme
MSTPFIIRPMATPEWDKVATLIHSSTNSWYRKNLNRDIFGPDPLDCRIFPEVYEALDPGCCLVAVDPATGTLCGSCFYHPRETHWSLGIMNAASGARGAAKALLAEITRRADEAGLPLRLVSSASNMDSFSLYSRAGFVPERIFQDMLITVPAEGMDPATRPEAAQQVRAATLDDLPAMVALEQQCSGIRREKDYRHFLENRQGIWSTLILEGQNGPAGFLSSVAHPGSRLLGPGLARDPHAATALIWAQLDRHHRGQTPVWLVPCDSPETVHACYRWGARNCELHLAQVRGAAPAHRGLLFPTFMPETG